MKETASLRQGTVLTDLEQVKLIADDEKESTPAHLAEILERVDPAVPESAVDKLGQLLRQYSKAFSANEYDLGWTDRVKHKIDTGDHPPARQPLRRLPLAQREIIDRHIDEQ